MSDSVLLVEDDPEIADEVRCLLLEAGYLVHCAVSVDEAVRLLATVLRPCIVLWDAVMSGDKLTLLGGATREGVNVAILPVTVASARGATTPTRRPVKTLVGKKAILSIVQENCPHEAAASPN